MASKKNEKKERPIQSQGNQWISESVRNRIVGVCLFAFALFLLLSAWNLGGVAGRYTYSGLQYLFGAGYYLAPLLFIFLGVSFVRSIRPQLVLTTIVGGTLFLLSGLAMVEMLLRDPSYPHAVGGIVGYLVLYLFEKPFGVYVSAIFLAALFVIALLILFETKLIDLFGWLMAKFRREETESDLEDEDVEVRVPVAAEAVDEKHEEAAASAPVKKAIEKVKKAVTGGEEFDDAAFISKLSKVTFVPPPLSLLLTDSGKPSAGDIKANANIIKRTLANFGIEVEMDEVTVGPSITRYALKPAEGVKLSKIVGLQNDLSMALAAHPLRIEAPIPGKSQVGIEIPNTTKSTVRLGSILADSDFVGSQKPLLVSLGRDIAGVAHFGDLAKMPHLLIAGTTGSGKSVTIHTIIASLLYRNSPENLRFIMIDPKRVELTLYNKISHLLTPVITDAKKTILALKWAAKEMDRRYDILEAESVRDIQSYHENIVQPALTGYREKVEGSSMSEEERNELEKKLPETMPYIVIIIDELADIMSTYPRELEAAVVRLAQMSRAVGIHLILSTQRPSTEVITGLIKANIPSRIALQVPSQIDSRTIIDMPGAEKLLGSGDMLYLSGEMSKPRRIQSAYVTEAEVKKVVQYLANAYQDELPQEIHITDGNNGSTNSPSAFFDDAPSDDDDELYEEARSTVVSAGKASSSLLQRKLKVGYARAARLLDMLEERGVVGPGEGAKPREVYGSEAGSASDEYAQELDEEQKNAS